ncbi:UDP-N-acetylglucosamine 2-epimerase [bacterium]|nr:UDP-N-acetylglucosamine 2-epimerase [bacterium]
MKKICVVTGSRAEYGLLRWVLEGIKESKLLDLQLIVTGMHLLPEFGLTVNSIVKDGFYIDKKIELLLSSDTPVGITKSMGLGLIGFAEALNELMPDLLLVLGDRFEILSAVNAALLARIPIAHIHGGESTEGAIDEAIRHSITKMSHIHFVASKTYKNRVIQLGEHPNNVYNVGGLGIDNLIKLNLLDKNSLEKDIEFKFKKINLLITFHPVTLENNTSKNQMNELLHSLSNLRETGLIFTMPNADTDSKVLFEMIQEFVQKNSNAKVFSSLGQLRYLSCIKYVDAVIGNSSSGLIEVPHLKKPTINIGDRQKGRLKADTVLDCEPKRLSITKALNKALSNNFRSKIKDCINPYGNGGGSEKIVKIIEGYDLNEILKKNFYDIPQ